MKNSKFLKFALLTVVLAMLVGAYAGLTVSAEDAVEPEWTPAFAATADLAVELKNIEYSAYMHIAVIFYEEQVTTLKANGYTLGIYVYGDVNANAPVTQPDYKSTDERPATGFDSARAYYATQGIAAKEMSTELLIVPVAIKGDEVLYGTGFKYSVVDYCNERLDELAKIVENGNALDTKQENQKVLYNAVLNYGLAAGDTGIKYYAN